MLGPLSAFLSSCTWALAVTAYDDLGSRNPAYRVHFTRALCGTIGFGIGSVFFWRLYASVSPRDLGFATLSTLTSYAFGDVLFLWSSARIGVPTALAIASVYPVWAALLSCALHHRWLDLIPGLGLLVVVAGVILAIITDPHAGNHPLRSKPGSYRTGILLALFTSLSWSVNAWSVSEISPDLNLWIANTLRMGSGLILCPLVARMIGAPKGPLLVSKADFKKHGTVIVGESFFGSLFYLYGLVHSGAAIGAALSSLAPVLTLPIAWFRGTERVSFRRALAMLLVSAGVWMLLQTDPG